MYKAIDHNNIPSSARRELMKITTATFGNGGYQDAQFGLYLDFQSKGSGVSTMICGGWRHSIKVDSHTKWTDTDRAEGMAKMCETISEILDAAKVQTVDKLNGTPVEIITESNKIKSFRILEEVL